MLCSWQSEMASGQWRQLATKGISLGKWRAFALLEIIGTETIGGKESQAQLLDETAIQLLSRPILPPSTCDNTVVIMMATLIQVECSDTLIEFIVLPMQRHECFTYWPV